MAKRRDIERYSADDLEAKRRRGESRTDWAKVDAMTESELEASIAADPDEPTVDNFEFADTGRSFERYTLPVRDETGPIGRLSVTRPGRRLPAGRVEYVSPDGRQSGLIR